MSRKDYVKLAAAINAQVGAAKTPETLDAIKEVARAIADVCAEGNERFDYRRFLTACGLNLN